MDKLGDAVLDHDTDSIIYASNDKNDPHGNFLGSSPTNWMVKLFLTSPLFTGGPKNYAYRTSKGKTCCKVRGFALNFKNSQTLNFDSIKHLVCALDQNDTISIHDAAKITRDGKKRSYQY
ncbi:hypothetical protein AVEN_229701-1 [Araneus ventricosus]|uniref:Uncharacterized protein n=1 Tax=Araneus ventricosus TaxID=182803 RepID=A0A4Y2R674_ARAVE|nr:hypothetical protein AVEN_229701-1 [Araneus ventricosus]